MPIKTLFPTFVYLENLQRNGGTARRFNEELLQECYGMSELDEAGQKWSRKNYVGGYTSYASLNDMHRRSTTFEKLKTLIDRHVKSYVRFLEMDLQNRKLEMTTCWINIMPRHTYHSMHIHPLSTISGTYYVKTPSKGGCFKIEDPRMGFFMAAPPKIDQCSPKHERFVQLRPQSGKVLLFESWLRHEVPPNQDDEDRVSISFNYDWIS